MGALFATCWLLVAASGGLPNGPLVLLAVACGIVTMSLASPAAEEPTQPECSPSGCLVAVCPLPVGRFGPSG